MARAGCKLSIKENMTKKQLKEERRELEVELQGIKQKGLYFKEYILIKTIERIDKLLSK
jgi:hypothetical protein